MTYIDNHPYFEQLKDININLIAQNKNILLSKINAQMLLKCESSIEEGQL